jgi:signal transduction histidine kinase
MKLILFITILLSSLSYLYSGEIYPKRPEELAHFEKGYFIGLNSRSDSVIFEKGWAFEQDQFLVKSGGSQQIIPLKNEKVLDIVVLESHIALLTDLLGDCYLSLYDYNLQQVHNIRTSYTPNQNLRLIRQDNNIILQDRNSSSVFVISKGKLVKKRTINGCCSILSYKDYYIAFFKNNRYAEVVIVNDSGGVLHSEHLPTYKHQRLIKTDSLVFLMGSFGYETDIYCFTMKDLMPVKRVNVPADINNINILPNQNDIRIRYTQTSKTHTSLIAQNFFHDDDYEVYDLDKYFYKLLKSHTLDDKSIWLFANGILLADYDSGILSAYEYSCEDWVDSKSDISLVNNFLTVRGEAGSSIFELNDNNWWLWNSLQYKYGNAILIAVVAFAFLIVLRFARNQKKLLKTVIDLPGTGVILVIDKYSRLINLNSPAAELLSIKAGVPLKKLYTSYFADEGLKILTGIIDFAVSKRENLTRKVNLLIGNDTKEWLCTVKVMTNIAGKFTGVVFTGIDITEQLEKKRLTNWAQLAHDMQTNLSTIKLNAEHLQTEEDPNNHSRKKKIIHQVNLLMSRVRDIVTVGRSDKLNTVPVNSSDICIEARNEFDDTVFPDVSFDVIVAPFMLNCDKPKLIRAVRNAIENAIKAMPDRKGNVTISCDKDSRHAYFRVKDDGPGMTKSTLEKIIKPYFTTAEKTGGMGMGTMIMQHVAEMHGGSVKFNSEPGKGTEVIFIIPIRNRGEE